MNSNCDIKHCKKESVIIILSIRLCDKHYDKQLEGKELKTKKKGILRKESGLTVWERG